MWKILSLVLNIIYDVVDLGIKDRILFHLIANAFNIKDNNYSLMTFPDYDNIIWEEDW